jgi:hypothetical protein
VRPIPAQGGTATFDAPLPVLEIHHIDSAGGDCTAIIIRIGPKIIKKILIDAGAERNGANRVKAYLHRFFYEGDGESDFPINKFDLYISSHYHADHIKGLQDNKIQFDYFMDTGLSGDEFIPLHGNKISGQSNFFAGYKEQLRSCGTRVPIPFIEKAKFTITGKSKAGTPQADVAFSPLDLFPPNYGIDLKLTCYCADGVMFEGTDVLGPQLDLMGRTTNPNDHSIGFLLRWGKFTYYTAGDLSGDLTKSRYYNIEESLVNILGGMLGDKGVSAMKASHHGSDDSSHPAIDEGKPSEPAVTPFLEIMQPKTIVVPCNMMKGVPGAHFLKRIETNPPEHILVVPEKPCFPEKIVKKIGVFIQQSVENGF